MVLLLRALLALGENDLDGAVVEVLLLTKASTTTAPSVHKHHITRRLVSIESSLPPAKGEIKLLRFDDEELREHDLVTAVLRILLLPTNGANSSSSLLVSRVLEVWLSSES